ncbi:MAG: peptidylprolyl isomerase [Candidatus Moranbacteria bacterium]|nr:peptidylprolyl isomerase [Candidatus Moranbacteria bacterium]
MKIKIGFLALTVLLLSGCGAAQKVEEAKQAAQDLENTSRQIQENAGDLTREAKEKAQNIAEEKSKALPEQAQEIIPGDSSDSKNSNPPSQEEIKNYNQKYSGAVIKTNLGDIEVNLYNEKAPKTAANFLKLAENGFYNKTKFHRVIQDFMIQGGDPNSKDDNWADDGRGGPGYKFEDEINDEKLVEGSLAMANSGPDTNGSQFFIVTAEKTPHLDGKHTNFGEVVEGMDVVEKIEEFKTNAQDHPLDDIVIESVEMIEKQ